MSEIASKPLAWWTPQIGEREHELVRQVLESGYLNDGELTAQFERQIAGLLGASFAVAVTSGTTAIALALAAVGVGRGDEVIVPDITFIATANAATLVGATPVLVDVDPNTLTIDPRAIAAALTPRTKAIVPVHVSGRAADMTAILALARAHGLRVVEDAAEAFCSRHLGRFLGTFGDCGCFSFSPNKTITTGQGGLVVTNDAALHARLRELKDQGRPVRGTGGDDLHPTVGFNFKFTNLQAAVGIGQLEQLAARIERMCDVRRWYGEQLAGLDGISLFPFDLAGGEVPQWTDARVEHRDELDQQLAEQGIHCRRFWFPLHTQAPYRRSDEAFPNSLRASRSALWLPSSFTLTRDDVTRVCSRIAEFVARRTMATQA